MALNRRQLLGTLAAGLAWTGTGCSRPSAEAPAKSGPIRGANGEVDWAAVRDLFPLTRDWIHLAMFLLVSHPKPVAEAIDRFRRKIDADPLWIEAAAFEDSEGRPFHAIKTALVEYVGGTPEELCLTSNTTGGLAMACASAPIRKCSRLSTIITRNTNRSALPRNGRVPACDISRSTIGPPTPRRIRWSIACARRSRRRRARWA
jgi:isopenicillin-N epimerase